ncbi:DNA/RNA polymerase [Dendrothele bispora CBS 962.96]|uniref:DNA polymerase kappa n=1 Tax=Dendrothele bispora (strain CBS 962.96) TaxID=1314807 RepID=A0A4S8MQX6_DENBC|nr:DNA/RNA polymerase [Dendrothele bispora CBS 962.96]
MASQESASLLKRLAGPSSGKAGLAKDQTEINRIIAEASKGSKFYEARLLNKHNEKRKDKELTERINKLLKAREEALRNVDISKIELNVDRIVVELESQRDLSQTIVHVDMDAFYANVELLHNPDLKDKPFAVGYGVLTTASYEARKYGCRSGMASHIAKKLCPELILVPNNFSRYSEMSSRIMDIFSRYDPNMCPAGADEAYLNITEYCAQHDISPDDCVQEMRKAVFDDTKLTVSAGIAPNKVTRDLVKLICSDRNKPNGQFRLEFESKAIFEFMKDLSIRKVPGIGRVSERLLDSIGVKTCGDIFVQRAVISLLDKQFGLGLRSLLQTGLGIASNVVAPHQREERKSIGVERTFHTISDKEKLFEKLKEISEELEKDMSEGGWAGSTVTLKYKLDTYQVFTRAKSSTRWITKKEDLLAIGKELLVPELPLSLRLIGLRVTSLKDLRLSDSVGIKRVGAFW